MASLVPTVGKAILSGRMIGGTPTQTEPRFVGWGTGAGAGSAASTDLSTAATEARVSGTSTQVTTTVTNDTHQVVGTITASGAKTITNVGVFDAAGTGSPPHRRAVGCCTPFSTGCLRRSQRAIPSSSRRK